MKGYSIRMAHPHEGPVIHDILASQSVTLATQADWTKQIGHYWLVAETTHPVGCLCVHPGQPMGRLEWLTVKPDVPKRLYTLICRDLCYAGLNTLRTMGSQLAAGYIANHDASWRFIAERRGWERGEAGRLMTKRI